MPGDFLKPELTLLLRDLMSWTELDSFSLVGGTSLALRFGYRDSDDIDLFTRLEFSSQTLKQELHSRFPGCEIESATAGSILAFIHGVKTDLLLHQYRQLQPDDIIDGIRVASLRDVSAMKMNAVAGRGSKKDFSDLLFLHGKGIALLDSVENYRAKYGEGGLFAALRSLTYFEDARDEPDPRYRNGWTWDYVLESMSALGRETQRRLEGRPG